MITCSLPILSIQKQTTTAAESEKACEKHCTYIFFLYLHKLTFAATHEKRLPSAFKMSQCISEREKKKDSFFVSKFR